jgi:hypothetical protein
MDWCFRENWHRKPSETTLFMGKNMLSGWPAALQTPLPNLYWVGGIFTAFWACGRPSWDLLGPPQCDKDDDEWWWAGAAELGYVCRFARWVLGDQSASGWFATPCKWPQVSHVGQLQSFDGDTVSRGLRTGWDGLRGRSWSWTNIPLSNL